jgi:gas vesicle protein
MAQRDTNSDPLSSNPKSSSSSSSNTAQQMKDQAKDLASQAKDQAKDLAQQAKQQASEVAGQAKDHVQGLVSQQKDRFAGQLGSLAGALRDAGHNLDEKDGKGLGQYANRAADQVDRASHYLRDHQLGDVIRDAETFARRRPDVFLGGTFLAGLLLARFLKASGENQDTWDNGNRSDRMATGSTGATYRRTGQSTQRPGQSFSQAGDRGYTAPRPYTPPVGG